MSPSAHYIRAGWLIDGTGDRVRKDVLLTVENGIFTSFDDFREGDSPAPSLVTDMSRCTVLPPLVDCHAHLVLSASSDPLVRRKQLADSYEEKKSRIADHLHYHFCHGVLAVRDGGDGDGCLLRYLKDAATTDKKRDPVRVKAAGPAWHRKGCYGSFLGMSAGNGDNSLENGVASIIDSVDHIKVINSGLNSLSELGLETASQFSCEELRNISGLASKHGKKVMVHANGHIPVSMALDAGVHSIEHGFFMGDGNLQQMAERGTFWVPTAFTMKAALGNQDFLAKPQGQKAVIEKTLERQLEQMGRARSYGVKMAIGTDAGTSGILHGESVSEEIKLFLKAGFSLVEAVRCATSNGAELLGINDIGKIARGCPAHFLVARATPAMLPRKLSYLEDIYIGGRPCDRMYFRKI